MKLLIENWRSFLHEDAVKDVILQYIKENNVQLAEEQIQEAMPGWVKKMVGAGMLIATAAGALVPNPAHADKWAEFDKEMSSMSMETGDSKFDMGDEKTSEKLAADAQGAYDSLAQMAQELEAAGKDKFKRLDILTKYGLMDQNTDAKSGKTTFKFKVQNGTTVQFTVATNQVPAVLVSR